MLPIENLFIKRGTLNLVFKITGPLLISGLVCGAIWTKKYYLAITNDDKYLYYKKFSKYYRIGSSFSAIAFTAIWTDYLKSAQNCVQIFLILIFFIGGLLQLFSGIYILDEKKFSNISPNALYIVKPLLKNSWLWVKFAVILGSLLLLYKMGEWIFLKIW